MPEIKNAIIKSATLSTADYGCLSSWLHLDYGGTGQGFGGYALYLPKSFTHHQALSFAGHYIWRVLEIAGVDEWSRLPGRTIRVRATNASVEAIGHVIKDDWFCPQDDIRAIDAVPAEVEAPSSRRARLDELMRSMPPEWRYKWCKSAACACLGCANGSGGLIRRGFTEKDFSEWVAANPKPDDETTGNWWGR